jgi:rod shape-determining protein MreB
MTRVRSPILGTDIAVDLGTANTVVYVRGVGVVLDEPSVVATSNRTGELIAVGNEAERMLGRTPPHLQTIRPLAEGVVADLQACETMLRAFIRRVSHKRWVKPRLVMCVPSGVTGVEQRAVMEVAEAAGARKPVHIIEEPVAAAIGAGLPVHRPAGNMVVDIGGGTTEIAVVSLGGVVASRSAKVAGRAIDQAIVTYIKTEHGITIGERSAEQIKLRYGSAWPLKDEEHFDVGGSQLGTGLPISASCSSAELRDAVGGPLSEIADAVRVTLDETPPELVSELMQDGIVVTGGGALLPGVAERLSSEVDLPVFVADNPLHSVVIGAGRYLEGL